MKIKNLLTLSLCLSLIQAEYNLDNCETDIASDVPEFFQKYFHCVTARMSETGNYINLYFNGKPPYESWYYLPEDPNYISWESQGTGYFQVPNVIEEQEYVIQTIRSLLNR